jgi:hypothetical protein
MSVETYGEHQEGAAAALNRLITADEIPAEVADVEQILHCRDIVIDALRQRLYALGLNTHHPATAVPTQIQNPRLTKVDQNLATLLDRVAFEAPTLRMDERRPATDVLQQRSEDTAVRLWQRAAIELLAGSHALDAAAERPWLRDKGSGWYLMRDVAVTMEAVLVLDSRMEEVGLLSGHNRPETTLGLEERRMITSQCARVATWHATSDSPDLATPDVPSDRVVVAGPVHTIREPTDLAAAQRQLATYLRPSHGNDVFYDGEPQIDSTTARMVVVSQVFLTRTFEAIAEKVPGTESIRAEFAARREILQDIQTSMAYLVDDQDRGRNMRAVWQQGELTTAVRRMQRDLVDMRMSPAQLHELASATHETAHNAAKALRRELLRNSSNLRMEDPTQQVGRTRLHRYHPLERSLTDMVNVPSPSAPVAKYSNPLQRAALRATLDVTPTSRRAPNPYPAARGVSMSSYGFQL